ncbi:NUDIX domain-containing protein [Lactobacillus psittaci]|uniref:Uncharacterized protein n=1 Tax=Lactobacillus psittaci DSM 15354 TaxID=1122152 RepID=A0A0R1S6N5_9LACO|nr:NUDIX domain-containing protein [Lactobacillus psittaci]KRL62133.1 hypothetical protein FC23_GL000387 [Lactobacillus psittaci DSM 15354]
MKRTGLIVYNPQFDAILLVHRLENEKDYWVVPSIQLNPNEAPKTAAKRICSEKLNLKLNRFEEAFTTEAENYYFYTETDTIEAPAWHDGPKTKGNLYVPAFVRIHELTNINLVGKEVKDRLCYFFSKLKKGND